MNKLITFFSLLICVGCIAGYLHNQKKVITVTEPPVQTCIPRPLPQPYCNTDLPSYNMDFRVETISNNAYALKTDINLDSGAFYISPNTKGDFSGLLKVIIEDNDHLVKNGGLIEIPKSTVQFEPWVQEPANFVRENTTYTQNIELTGTSDFEIGGYVQFVIEPRCTLERIDFRIVYKDGTMSVKKIVGC